MQRLKMDEGDIKASLELLASMPQQYRGKAISCIMQEIQQLPELKKQLACCTLNALPELDAYKAHLQPSMTNSSIV